MSTARTEVRIVAVRPNGPPVKRDYPFAVTWVAPVIYTLEDGTELPSIMSPFTRKRDAVEHSTPREDIYNMVAKFTDGEFVGTCTTYGIRDALALAKQ